LVVYSDHVTEGDAASPGKKSETLVEDFVELGYLRKCLDANYAGRGYVDCAFADSSCIKKAVLNDVVEVVVCGQSVGIIDLGLVVVDADNLVDVEFFGNIDIRLPKARADIEEGVTLVRGECFSNHAN
jgi:hypothetical protein